jgi:hypothetical protein
MRVPIAALAMAGFCSLATGAQEPSPSPPVWDAQVALFSSLPDRIPAKDLSSLKLLVADDVEVYRDGKLVHETRKAWFDELRDGGRIPPHGPREYSVSRDHYARTADGGVSVREFSYPIAPEGSHTVYHPRHPLRYVTYYIEGGKLVRVVYGPAMSGYAGLCQVVEAAKAERATGDGHSNPDLCR